MRQPWAMGLGYGFGLRPTSLHAQRGIDANARPGGSLPPLLKYSRIRVIPQLGQDSDNARLPFAALATADVDGECALQPSYSIDRREWVCGATHPLRWD